MWNCLRICALVLTLLTFTTDGAASPEGGPVEATGVAFTNLVVTMSGTPNPVEVGQTLTYTIIVSNEGSQNATGVSIEDNLPATFNWTSSSVPCTQAGTVLTCPVGDIAAGDDVTITIGGTPTAAGTITNTVTVEGDQVDSALADNTAGESTTVSPAGAVGVPLLDWRGLGVMIALMAITGMAIRR